MKLFKQLSCLVLALAIMTPNAHAADVWTMAESPSYGKKAVGMLGRGLINIVTSPVDLLVQTVDKTKSGPPIIGTLAGLGSGLGCTVVRILSGAVDVVTFWVPSFNGIPVSRSYSNCLEQPENTKGWDSNSAYNAAPASTWASSTTPSGSTTWAAPSDSSRYYDKNGVNRYVDKNGSPYGHAGAYSYAKK